MAFQSGYIASLEGNFEQAIKKINEAIPSDPRIGRYRFSLATAYIHAKRYREAIRAFQEALATDMNEVLRAYSYFHLGKIYEALGDTSKMKRAFTKVLELAPPAPARRLPGGLGAEGNGFLRLGIVQVDPVGGHG